MQLVIASNNPHKIDEISAIYAGLPLTIWSAQRAGLTLDVAETGTTFLENATLKVSAFPDLPQTMYLADDSGLEVAALAGRPGVHSARYGGPGLSDAARSAALLAELGNTADRRAQFVAVGAAHFGKPQQAEVGPKSARFAADEAAVAFQGVGVG